MNESSVIFPELLNYSFVYVITVLIPTSCRRGNTGKTQSGAHYLLEAKNAERY